jgi:hypothetical protein
MAATLFEREALAPERSRRCPTCDKPLTDELACWHCCDRLCRHCGQQTGTAFIGICWACWFQEARGFAGPDEK